jgi:hypothetical protein
MTHGSGGFHRATERVWVVWKYAGDGCHDDWWANLIFGWTGDGHRVYWDGEALAQIGPETPHLWTIVPDACLASAYEPVRRAIAHALTGSYMLADDPEETAPFGEREAA